MREIVEKLSTLVSVPVTPFDSNLRVDPDALRRNLQWMLSNGINVFTIGGNTGEFYSLTIEECRDITALACQELRHKATVIAGIGYDTETAIGMARQAQEYGAAVVMVHHPSSPFVTTRGYVDYIRAIASAVGIGVIPYVRAANVTDAAVLEVIGIENVVGVKYAVNEVQRFGGLVTQTPKEKPIAWLCGTAEAWAPFFFAAGATGYTSGLGNVAPRLSLNLLGALRQHDFATVRKLWALLIPFEELRSGNNSELNVRVVKEAMCQLRLGGREVRPPASVLSQDEREVVTQILKSWQEYL